MYKKDPHENKMTHQFVNKLYKYLSHYEIIFIRYSLATYF